MKGIINYIKDNDFIMHVFKNKIDIINYQELLSMTDERISITSQLGRIVIKGKNLSVQKLLNKEILVVGKLISIEIGEDHV